MVRYKGWSENDWKSSQFSKKSFGRPVESLLHTIPKEDQLLCDETVDCSEKHKSLPSQLEIYSVILLTRTSGVVLKCKHICTLDRRETESFWVGNRSLSGSTSPPSPLTEAVRFYASMKIYYWWKTRSTGEDCEQKVPAELWGQVCIDAHLNGTEALRNTS